MAVAGTMFQANAAEHFEPKTKLRPNKTILLYPEGQKVNKGIEENGKTITLGPVSYTHFRANETDTYLVCRLLLGTRKK